jgi:glycosyltransferase involved in cell wall biosynthesis
MKRSLRVTLAHPGGGPFVLQAARAFAERGLLARLATTIVHRPESIVQRVACRLSRLFGFDLARQLRRRAVLEVPSSQVLSYPWREVLRQMAARLEKSGVLQDQVWEWAELGFDRWVARHALQGATAVYGYEHACRFILEEGRRRGLFCVYDVPAPEHEFTHRILRREIDRFPELLNRYQKRIRRPEIHERRSERRRREWHSADLVIANSEFTRESYAAYEDSTLNGRGLSKVCVVPYGAPPAEREGIDGGSRDQGPLRFLWAGTFSLRKGAHYLIDAWKRARIGLQSARVDVYGAVTLPAALLAEAPSAFRFHGSVPREELYPAYRQADVFVFPTLCDGFGMVVTESFSQGLPVITTRSAGAADLIRHDENGWIVPSADSEALAEVLQQCVDHRPDLRGMRREALRTAESWQWSDYRAALATAVIHSFVGREESAGLHRVATPLARP